MSLATGGTRRGGGSRRGRAQFAGQNGGGWWGFERFYTSNPPTPLARRIWRGRSKLTLENCAFLSSTHSARGGGDVRVPFARLFASYLHLIYTVNFPEITVSRSVQPRRAYW